MKKLVLASAAVALALTTGFTCAKNAPEQAAPAPTEAAPAAPTEAAPAPTEAAPAAPTEAAPAAPAETK